MQILCFIADIMFSRVAGNMMEETSKRYRKWERVRITRQNGFLAYQIHRFKPVGIRGIEKVKFGCRRMPVILTCILHGIDGLTCNTISYVSPALAMQSVDIDATPMPLSM